MLISEVNNIRQNETKKGNLDAAMAIKAKLEDLVTEEKQNPTTNLPTPGDYQCKQGTYTISVKGDKIPF
jgi:hypothetical protein